MDIRGFMSLLNLSLISETAGFEVGDGASRNQAKERARKGKKCSQKNHFKKQKKNHAKKKW